MPRPGPAVLILALAAATPAATQQAGERVTNGRGLAQGLEEQATPAPAAQPPVAQPPLAQPPLAQAPAGRTSAGQVPAAPPAAPPAAMRPPASVPTRMLPAQTIEAPDGGGAMLSPVLSVDPDALFARSAWGRRVQADLEAEGRALQAENDRLAAQLSEEEAALTRLRPDLDAADFRQRAEAFDARATQIRRERAQAVADLNARAEADRTAFYQAALPLMGTLMQERGAVAVLDRRTVFVSVDVIDITDELVSRLDAELGDGLAQPERGSGKTTSPQAAPKESDPGGAVPGGSARQGSAPAPARTDAD